MARMTCGIYILRFKDTHKVYIGKSTNIEKRFLEHKSSFNTNTAARKLQTAYTQYGVPSIEVLVVCDKELLDTNEVEAIEIFNSITDGFNTLLIANGGSNLYGELSPNSKYSNVEYEKAFFALLDNPNLTYIEISNISKIPATVLSHIVAGNSHSWLSNKYPKEYLLLQELYTNKNIQRSKFNIKPATTSKLDRKEVVKVLKYLVSNTEMNHNQISELTGIKLNTIRDISSMRRHTWLANVCPVEYAQLKQIKGK